jgi:REP element-mobilizing transposase RayT
MTRPRSQLVSLSDTPWYHVVSRCVRRAFLCGEDAATGRNFDHRRGWIEARIRQLASVFTIDVAAYAVMSNHYHIVLKVDRERAESLSEDDVLERWSRIFTGPMLVQRYLDPEKRDALGEAELDRVREDAAVYRERLADLSWYMRVLNEGIARLANQEDGVKGRFWEGRFKSQALLDEEALLAAMAYVDLNPIRAGMAETPEESDYTSVQARLLPEVVQQRLTETIAAMRLDAAAAECRSGGDGVEAAAEETVVTEATATDVAQEEAPARANDEVPQEALATLAPAPLMPFDATGREAWAIPYAFEDYVELVETLGRCLHPEKRGLIPERTPKLLDRLGIDTAAFIEHGTRFLKEFGHAVGKPASLIELAAKRQAKFLRGMGAARRCFGRQAA